MLTIDGKQYRNLEEQVRKNKEDIQSIIDASAVLNAFGIKVVGQVNTSDKLPNPADYPGEYGDAYLVGTETPYDYYIFTRPNDTHPTAYWLNIGEFPLAGPQGETGPQGIQGPKGDGSKWYAGTQNPTIVAEINDQYLNTTDGSVFSYSNVGWTRIGNIRGPQGVQGIQGIQGIQGNIGPVGPKGERGDVGGIVNIRGLVDNVNQLPTPTSLQNLSIAYLVGTNKELYIQIGETPETATWNNMGILNVATYVTVDGQYVNVLEMNQYQNKIRFLQLTGTSGTLTSQQINLLRSDNTNYIIVDNELYNCNDLQDANGYLVYTHTGADTSNNVNIKTLSITLTNNNWSIQTTPVQPKIPVANTNEAVQFAEDERQKSKNLFDLNTMVIYNQGAEINKTSGSDITFYYSSTTAVVKIPVLPNKTYYLSSNNIQFYIGETQSNGTTQTGNPDNNLEWSTNTIITTTDNTYFLVAVVRYIGADIVITKDVFQNSNTQLEYGNKQTSYQPYNGQITHNGDAPVVFAESERQKSKNLFPYSTITGTEFYQQHLNTPIKAGTYTISALVSSSDTDSDLSSIVFENEDKSYIITVNLSRNSRSSTTFTINQDCSYVTFFASNSYVNSSGDTFTFSNIQIEEGSVATDYQPYNGAIVHKEEIADVEHIKTIYDMSSSDSNINKGYTAGKQFDDNATGMPIDLSDYKKLRLCFKLYNQSIVYFDFGIPNNTYFTMCAVCMEPTYSVNNPIMLSVYYSNGNLKCYKAVLGISEDGGNLNNSDNAVLIKVQGVK